MKAHPIVRRATGWAAWGAATGIALGALVGWYLADQQFQNVDCTVHLCEGGLQVPVGMFFGSWAGAGLGLAMAIGYEVVTRRRRNASRP